MRLDKFLADTTDLTRSLATKAVKSGRVLVNGVKPKSAAAKVADSDEITLDGERLILQTGYRYILLHKPAGYVCANRGSAHPLVFDLLKGITNRLDMHTVGRLDLDTTGLLLITDDGRTLFDSRVIVEYLDHLAGGGRIIPIGEARFPVLCMQSLADGIMDAALLEVYENRFRPKEWRYKDWTDYQAAKVTRALTALEEAPPAPLSQPSDADAGNIALACALGYLDLRFKGQWRDSYPKLVAWLESFEAAIPGYAATRTPPAPVPDKESPLR